MKIQKQYARRNVEGFSSTNSQDLKFVSISELGQSVLEPILNDAMSGSKARDIYADKGWIELEELKEAAGDAYHPDTWVVAYKAEQPVGVVFAQRYDDKPEEGSLFFIGVLPEYRGQGLSKALHAKGLEMLASVGVKEYVGSTDVQNEAMVKTFEANGCRLYAIRDVEIGEGLA